MEVEMYAFSVWQIIVLILGVCVLLCGLFLAFRQNGSRWWIAMAVAGLLIAIFAIFPPHLELWLETPPVVPASASSPTAPLAGEPAVPVAPIAATSVAAPASQLQGQQVIINNGSQNSATLAEPAPAVQIPAASKPVAPIAAVPVAPAGFTPDWSGLNSTCPSKEQVLKDHGLTAAMVIDVAFQPTVWEPCLTVIEFKPEFRGTKIPLKNGYQYNAALNDDSVQTLWGGDSKVTSVTLLWGTSFRWAPTYVASKAGQWLNPNDQCELVTREYRFGRYLRSDEPYFGRKGPYVTDPGNTNCSGWVPPALDDFTPSNYMEAAAMLGGRAVKEEWTTNGTNWAWKYAQKVPGSATYCAQSDPCWQTTYVPLNSDGFIELWFNGGPVKFSANENLVLRDGRHNVDEFSYHPYADR